jgi:hypothetical protein
MPGVLEVCGLLDRQGGGGLHGCGCTILMGDSVICGSGAVLGPILVHGVSIGARHIQVLIINDFVIVQSVSGFGLRGFP